jgi:hypothetical protein
MMRAGSIAAGLLLVVAGQTSGMEQTRQPASQHRDAVKKKPQSRPPVFDYRRGNSNWPYGSSYNVPYPDRPYGDPGHGGE